MSAVRLRSNRRARFISAALFAAALPLSASADFNIYPVARTNDHIPGAPAGTNFTFFSVPSINASGVTAFRSQSSGFSLYSGLPGQISPIAVSGAQVPDLPAGTKFSIPDSRVSINAAGTVSFSALYSGTASGTGGFANIGGTLTSIVLPGDPLVGHPGGGTFNSFGTNDHPVIVSDNGTFAYQSWTSTFPNAGSYGNWAGPSKAGMVKGALEGDPVPGLGSNVFWNSTGYPVLNPSGQLAFQSTITGSGTTFNNRDGIWAGPASAIAPVVRSDSLAPGTGSKFSSFNDPNISRSGQVAFHADLDFTEAFAQREGIWAGTAGNLKLVARAATPAPGTGGAVFGTFMGDPLINAAGIVSFNSPLSGAGVTSTTNGQGLFTGGDANHLTLVARLGDHAPGTPDGVNFAWPSDFSHTLNDLGQIAFTARLTGTGVDSTNDNGLWVYDPILGTRLVVREGQTIQVGPGLTKTVSSIDALVNAATGDGRGTSLNDRGQIAMTLGFTSGIYYGIFVADVGGILPGDLDHNGTVTAADRASMLAIMGQSATPATGDLNGDGIITTFDLQLLDNNLGQTLASWTPPVDLRTSEVPEPGSAALLLVAASTLLTRRRR